MKNTGPLGRLGGPAKAKPTTPLENWWIGYYLRKLGGRHTHFPWGTEVEAKSKGGYFVKKSKAGFAKRGGML